MPSPRRRDLDRPAGRTSVVRLLRREDRVLGHRRRGFTTRAAVLGLVLVGLLVSLAVPLREYLSQRGEIGRAEQAQAAQAARVAALEEQRRLLSDPAYVQQVARERLHYVMPGETAYVVLRPTPTPGAGDEDGGPGAERPWYSQLWESVRAADAPSDR